jgi:hypothetical protein
VRGIGTVERVTLRIPIVVYKKMKRIKRQNPHLSLNAVMVELLSRSLQKPEAGR